MRVYELIARSDDDGDVIERTLYACRGSAKAGAQVYVDELAAGDGRAPAKLRWDRDDEAGAYGLAFSIEKRTVHK